MSPEDSPNCPPDSPKEEKSFGGRFLDWIKGEKKDVKERKCKERKSPQVILQVEEVDWFDSSEAKFLDVKGVTEERLSAALFAINNALDFINSNPSISEAVKANGIKIREPAYYLALAVKETMLNPVLKGNTGNKNPDKHALGYFQVKKAAMEGVNKKFGMDYSRDEVFSEAELGSSEQAGASINNAVIGILYWHISEGKFKEPIAETMPPEDRDKITAMIYFLGPSGFNSLYVSLGKPKTFPELAKGVAKHLSQKFKFLSVQAGGLSTSFSPTYGVETRSYLDTGSLGAGKVLKKLRGKSIIINGEKFGAQNLFEAIRYAEITSQLIHDKELKAPEVLSYKVRPGESLYKIAKGLLPRYGIELKDQKLEERIIMEIVALNNPDGRYDKLQVGAEIAVPSKQAVYKRLAEKGIIHIIQKGEGMNIIAAKVAKKHGIEPTPRARIHKLGQFLVVYNKKVNKVGSKKLIPEKPVYIPEKSELEAALS